MFVVALAELAGDLDDEAAHLAPSLGLAPYDVKARFSGVLPRVIFQTPDHAEAARVLALIRGRGHGGLICDSRAVPPATSLVRLHRFSLEDDSLAANDGGPRLAYADIAAILVTRRRTSVARETDEVVLVGGGKSPPTHVHVQQTRNEQVADQAAYLFLRGAADEPLPRPWFFHESEAQYRSLGPAMRPVRRDNFLTTLLLLRGHAPHAIYDDRFSATPIEGAHLVHVRGHESPVVPANDAHGDLVVHLLATWLLGSRSQPYR